MNATRGKEGDKNKTVRQEHKTETGHGKEEGGIDTRGHRINKNASMLDQASVMVMEEKERGRKRQHEPSGTTKPEPKSSSTKQDQRERPKTGQTETVLYCSCPRDARCP